MDKAAIVFHLLLTVMLLALFPLAESIWPQPLPHPRPRPLPNPIPDPPPPAISLQPLCASQFSLVNDACSKLPNTLGPSSSPTTLASTDEPNEGHRHHKHHHNHKSTPEEEECCRWLTEVDNVCVCDLLVHLPPFLITPMHNYTVSVHEACEVTFSCGPMLVRP